MCPIYKKKILKYSFCNTITPIWITLPYFIVTSNTIFAFKKKVKSIDFSKWLLDQL